MRKIEKGISSVIVAVGSGMSVALLSGVAWGACTSAPDCGSLGYTKTSSSCPNGGVKCPFDTSKWFCQESCTYTATASSCSSNCQNVGSSSCVRNGTTYYSGCGSSKCGSGQYCSGGSCVCSSDYKYNCSGTGYSGGSGTSCNNKYTSCSCSSGYSWTSGSCVKNTPSVAPSGYCCTDTGTNCGNYSSCKNYYNFPDCSAMMSSCRSAGGSPVFQVCYDGDYASNHANYDCRF